MRALVSGASGFIGKALVARLERDGYEVHRIVRSAPGPGEVLLDVDNRTLDISRLAPGALEDLHAVYHLAGEPITARRWGPAKREAIRSSRIATTDALARAIATWPARPAVLVSGSAIGIYGDRGDEVLDESSATGDGFLAEVCRAWEAATAPARDIGVRVVNVRTGLVLGDGGLLGEMLPLFRRGLGGRLGDGRQWMSWIALVDEVAALVHAASTTSLSGPCNLVSPNPVRNSEFTSELGEALGKRQRVAVPRVLLELALGHQTAHEMALASQRVLPRQLKESGFAFSCPTVHDALREALGAT